MATFSRLCKEGTPRNESAPSPNPNDVFVVREVVGSFLVRSDGYDHDMMLDIHGEKVHITILVHTCCIDNLYLAHRCGFTASRSKAHLPFPAPIASPRSLGERVSVETSTCESFSFHAQDHAFFSSELVARSHVSCDWTDRAEW